MTRDTFLVYTTMKNEGPYMLDWVAYYQSLGVDQFLIYTNDCDDGTDAIAQRLTELGIAVHVDNKVRPGGSPQNQMLRRIRKQPAFKAATWALSIDVDEYLNIRLPDATLPSLMAKLEEVAGTPLDAASFAWKLFGCSGIEDFADTPVTRQFFLCDDEIRPHSSLAQGLKSITRNNGKFTRYGPHRPKGVAPEDEAAIAWSDASGQLMPYASVSWRANAAFGHEFARMHHYAVRSVDAFLVKRDRGRTNHVDSDQAESYWNNMNANVTEDRTILPAVERAEPLRQALLADPVLADLHARAVAWHQEKIASLRAREEWAGFRAFLAANRLARVTPDN